MVNQQRLPAGLYIHIPFCLKKCGYCDFLSFSGYDQAFLQQYVSSLVSELAIYKEKNKKIDSIFIGGGTPSLLREHHIIQIMEAAEAAFCVAEGAEISLEANPKTLTKDKLNAYRSAGVNRLSIGAQSMDDGLLNIMGRAHSRTDFLENYQAARAAGFSNINVDLMFGIPGQTRQMWEESLEIIISLQPEHISFYSLQLEEGTPFYKLYKSRIIDLPPTEEDRWMYHTGIRMLRDAGYVHYEISNCAKKGYECRHNLKYWSFHDYYGVGLGAHSFQVDFGRRYNVTDFDTYFQKLKENQLPVHENQYEPETTKELMGEYVFTALRKAQGLNLEDFSYVFGKSFFQVYEEQMHAILDYKERGYLTLDGQTLALTEKGIDISNEIMAEFV